MSKNENNWKPDVKFVHRKCSLLWKYVFKIIIMMIISTSAENLLRKYKNAQFYLLIIFLRDHQVREKKKTALLIGPSILWRLHKYWDRYGIFLEPTFYVHFGNRISNHLTTLFHFRRSNHPEHFIFQILESSKCQLSVQ